MSIEDELNKRKEAAEMGEKTEQQEYGALTSDEALEKVAGGTPNGEPTTLMQCDTCGHQEEWRGDYMDGKYYHCPNCGEMKLRGIMAWN